MNMMKMISATAGTVLTAVSFLAIAEPVPTQPAERSATTASPKTVMKSGSDTALTTTHLQAVQAGLLDTSTTRAVERIAPTPGNTMAA